MRTADWMASTMVEYSAVNWEPLTAGSKEERMVVRWGHSLAESLVDSRAALMVDWMAAS